MNISNNRTLEIHGCEFFENGNYKQVVLCAEVVDGSKKLPVAINVLEYGHTYENLKSIATCEFTPIANIIKAEACQMVLDFLVPDLDSKGLFDNLDT